MCQIKVREEDEEDEKEEVKTHCVHTDQSQRTQGREEKYLLRTLAKWLPSWPTGSMISGGFIVPCASSLQAYPMLMAVCRLSPVRTHTYTGRVSY